MYYFDLHCDTISECMLQGQGLYENSLAVSLRRAACFDAWGQVFALFMPDEYRGAQAVAYFDRLYAQFVKQTQANAARLAVCAAGWQAMEAMRDGKCAAFLSVEGGSALAGDPSRVRVLYGKGVRLMTITWNGDNELASGCMGSGGGLTPAGVAVLREMEAVGMLADVSHLNERGFYDVCAHTAQPIVATHSDCMAVHAHPRNLTDDQIKEIVRRGGLIGLNLYPLFLGEGDAARQLYRHLEHVCKLGGAHNAALGCDYDGAVMPAGYETVDAMAHMYAQLRRLGVPESLLDDFFYKNAQSFFNRVLV